VSLYCTQLGKTNLRVLDYKRIKDAERASAKSLFEDAETGLPSQLAHSLTSEAATNAANAAANAVLAQSSTGASKNANGAAARSMTEDEKARVREAIKGASSIEEVKRLQRMLAEGKVPEGQAV
jgi:U2 small nuclear ribonucleoprotein A'